MQVEIKHRFNGSVLFTAELDASFEDKSFRVQLGAAVKLAYKSDAVLRGAVLRGADLRGAVLRDADLRGAVLRDADLRGAVLRGADLRDAVLRDADLRGAVLRGADLRDADLRDADLRGADLRDADLRDADLRDADLSDAVLRGADAGDLKGVPKLENIDAQILGAIEDGGELNMDTWHTCETTHCRAGWAVILAGAGGAALEFAMGTAAAASMIYLKSRPGQNVPDFYCNDETAMADIRKCAAEQLAASK